MKIIISKFPIEKNNRYPKEFRDAITEEIIVNYEKNKTSKKTKK